MKKENRKIKKENSYCLPLESRLNQRYIIKKVLGEGGFGITYLGWDEVLEMPVAIKEYYPEGMVGRRPQGREEHTLYTYEDGKRIVYEKGKEAFLKEARMLSQFFGLEGIVLVRDYFQENETAYIVMEYIEGTSVKEQVREKGAYSVEETLELMKPVLQALHTVHEKGLIHRDLSPDNIIVNSQGKLKLIDFGAARYASAQEQKTITLMYKRGFAAFEQYRVKGEQGAWTDVYGIAATMYFMMTGKIPEESADRVIRDELVSLAELFEEKVSQRVSDVIGKAMAVLPEERYQDIEKFYRELYGEQILIANSVKKFQEKVNETSKDEEISESNTASTDNAPFFSTKTLGRELQRVMGKWEGAEYQKQKKQIGLTVGILLGVLIVAVVVWKNGSWKQMPTALPSKTEKIEQKALQSETGNTKSEQEASQLEENTIQPSVDSEQDLQLISMPELTGKTKKETKAKLKQLKLAKIQWKYRYSGSVEKGRIIRQNISKGTEIAIGKKIVLVVSKGKKPPEVTSQPESTQSSTSTSSSGDKQKDFVGSLDSVFE